MQRQSALNEPRLQSGPQRRSLVFSAAVTDRITGIAMSKYKYLIGFKLRARRVPAQRGEVAIAAAVLNTMIRAAEPDTAGSTDSLTL